jgi:hypothetical protein
MTARNETLAAIEKVKADLNKGKKLSPSCRKAGISTTTFYRHVPEYKSSKAGIVVDRASDDLPKRAYKKRGPKPKVNEIDSNYVRKLEHFIATKLVETIQ